MLVLNCLSLTTGGLNGYFYFILYTAKYHCLRISNFNIQSEFKIIFSTCYSKVKHSFGSVLGVKGDHVYKELQTKSYNPYINTIPMGNCSAQELCN